VSAKRTATPLRGSGRRKPLPRPTRGGSHRRSKAEQEILRLVRAGIQRFILRSSTVEEFARAMQALGESDEAYAHQLTKPVLAKIVRDALHRRARGSGRRPSHISVRRRHAKTSNRRP
jgi:hypothetical protein